MYVCYVCMYVPTTFPTLDMKTCLAILVRVVICTRYFTVVYIYTINRKTSAVLYKYSVFVFFSPLCRSCRLVFLLSIVLPLSLFGGNVPIPIRLPIRLRLRVVLLLVVLMLVVLVLVLLLSVPMDWQGANYWANEVNLEKSAFFNSGVSLHSTYSICRS